MSRVRVSSLAFLVALAACGDSSGPTNSQVILLSVGGDYSVTLDMDTSGCGEIVPPVTVDGQIAHEPGSSTFVLFVGGGQGFPLLVGTVGPQGAFGVAGSNAGSSYNGQGTFGETGFGGGSVTQSVSSNGCQTTWTWSGAKSGAANTVPGVVTD